VTASDLSQTAGSRVWLGESDAENPPGPAASASTTQAGSPRVSVAEPVWSVDETYVRRVAELRDASKSHRFVKKRLAAGLWFRSIGGHSML
jgi:hypothetical protein